MASRMCRAPGCENPLPKSAPWNRKYCSGTCKRDVENAAKRAQRQPLAEDPAVALPTVPQMMGALQSQGFRIEKPEPSEREWTLGKPDYPGQLTFAVMGDTHFGSKTQQMSALHDFYREVEAQGIKTVLHMGDLVHGSHKMHRDMPFELFLHGADAQLDYAVENYPRAEGATTYIISGNHDDSHWNDAGVDIVRRFAEERNDVEYLGQRTAYVDLSNDVDGKGRPCPQAYMMHPKGGTSYARSYRLQKLIEQLAPEAKPHFLFVGHYHCTVHLPGYRNVEGFLTPCFEAQTKFERTLGLFPVIGGLILHVTWDEDGVQTLDTEWHLTRVPKTADY